MKLRTSMKLSDNTLKILKNFSGINQSILIKKGSYLRTINVMKNVYAEANIEEDFPRDFAIYDLFEFLNGLGLYRQPELDFSQDSHLLIKEGNRRVKYFYADPAVIVTPPDKEIKLPSEDIHFQIDKDQLDDLLKASSVYKLTDFSVIGEAGAIRLVVREKKNSTSNEFSVTVGTTNETFVGNFKVENIKIIPGKYDVYITKTANNPCAKFVNVNYNTTYFIAMEPDSSFN